MPLGADCNYKPSGTDLHNLRDKGFFASKSLPSCRGRASSWPLSIHSFGYIAVCTWKFPTSNITAFSPSEQNFLRHMWVLSEEPGSRRAEESKREWTSMGGRVLPRPYSVAGAPAASSSPASSKVLPGASGSSAVGLLARTCPSRALQHGPGRRISSKHEGFVGVSGQRQIRGHQSWSPALLDTGDSPGIPPRGPRGHGDRRGRVLEGRGSARLALVSSSQADCKGPASLLRALPGLHLLGPLW